MSEIDAAALIELVRKYPPLYDMTSPLYLNQQMKEEAWNEISVLMSASVNDCKTKWSRVRENYRKAITRKNTGGSNRILKYEKQLSFLNENFSYAPRKKNIFTLEPKNNESDEPTINIVTVEKANTLSPQTTVPNEFPKKDVARKQVSDVNAFFEGIAETVKTFPKKIQVQLKREVFNLVNDTEASLLDGSDTTVCFSTDSPILSKTDPESNMITDSPNHQASTSNEYATDIVDSLQTTDTELEHLHVKIEEDIKTCFL